MSSWDTRTGGGSAGRSEAALEAALLNYTDAQIAALGGGSGGWFLSKHLVRYVDPISGNDSRDGLSPGTAHLTIAHAYADLVSVAVANYVGVNAGEMGVGVINLLPGTHTLSAGLDMDYKYPVHFLGQRSGRHSHTAGTSQTIIKLASTTATFFFRAKGANIGYGWRFENTHFLIDQTAVTGNVALTSVINFDGVDDYVVENCSCNTIDNTTNLNIPWIKHDNSLTPPTGDAAWFRIRNNRYSRVALYAGGGTGASGNYNRWTIEQNVGFYGGTIPHVKFSDGAHGGHCQNNNFEGTAVAVELAAGSFTQCIFENNSGEDPSAGVPPNPYYLLSGSCSQIIFLGGTCSVPGGGSGGVWVEFRNASAYNNLVIGPYDYTGVAGEKRKIVDSSTANGNRIINLNSGFLLKVKTGVTNPTISDADFAPAPMDGTHALTVATATNETRMWVRANGVWTPLSNQAGGVSTQTPGAVSTVNIPHGLGAAPTAFVAMPGSANARGAPAFFATADATNVILNFAAPGLTGATAYSWNWMAKR